MRLVLFAALLPTAVLAQAAAQCRADAECTLTRWEGCCGSCCPSLQVMSNAELERARARCAVVDCARPNCAAVRCAMRPDPPNARAVCRSGQCVMESGVARSECNADADCMLTWPPADPGASCRQSPCGCCPGTTPVAVPRASQPHLLEDKPVAPPPRETKDRPKPPEKKDAPPFGLSQGHSGAPVTPPQCSPCPSPAPARAVCRIGRCAVEYPERLPIGLPR